MAQVKGGCGGCGRGSGGGGSRGDDVFRENDDGPAARNAAGTHQQQENRSCQQANRKVSERLARDADKSGSELTRLLSDAARYLAEDNPRPAEDTFRKCIALEPGHPSAYFNLGAICSNENRSVDAAHNFLDAATRFSEECVEWATSIALAFHHLLSPSCNEVAKPEWWNDESLKALSETVARVTGAKDGHDQSRLYGHLMRMKVLSGQHPGWQLGPRSAADLNEAAKHGGLAAQMSLARECAEDTGFALELLKISSDLFRKAADRDVIEAKIKAKVEAKAKIEEGAKAVVRAEAETKAHLAANALLAEEAAEAVAVATSAPAKGKGRSKGKSKSSGKP